MSKCPLPIHWFVDDSGSRIYVGLFVDKFIYFDNTPAVEEKFRTLMSALTLFTFKQDLTLFLGIKISKKPLPDDKLSIHLSQ